jgi:hypothetical protein
MDSDAREAARRTPDRRRVEQLRALLARLESQGGGDDPPTRAVRSLLEDAERELDDPPLER